MGKTRVTAWLFLLLSLGACAQPPSGSITLNLQHGRHLNVDNSTADVAENPDEHIKERVDDVGHHQ
jgi:hypothetical protein